MFFGCKKGMYKNMKVIIAMSSGVDSSVSAALLKNAGFEVVGVFIRFFDSFYDSEKKAEAIAKKLGVDFNVVDARKEFKNEVIDYFISDYSKGRTPNPCVICNREVKFDFLIKKMESLDADFIATGHYARIEGGKLLKGSDAKKDQSYFLWKLNQKILKKTLFPVGGYKKGEVKKIAEDLKLSFSAVKESQEVCFIDNSTSSFLGKYIKENPGNILCDSKKVGEHQGLWLYTIGQRKGLNLNTHKRWYVVKLDKESNAVIVGENEDVFTRSISCYRLLCF